MAVFWGCKKNTKKLVISLCKLKSCCIKVLSIREEHNFAFRCDSFQSREKSDLHCWFRSKLISCFLLLFRCCNISFRVEDFSLRKPCFLRSGCETVLNLRVHVHVSDDNLLYIDTPIVNVLIHEFLDFFLEHLPVVEDILILDLGYCRAKSTNRQLPHAELKVINRIMSFSAVYDTVLHDSMHEK